MYSKIEKTHKTKKGMLRGAEEGSGIGGRRLRILRKR